MIDSELAQQLQRAGLRWVPAKHDMFMIPGGDLANEVFTLTDQTILIHSVGGEYAVTFHGSVEWALDHVMLAEVIWLPTETQLREEIVQRVDGRAAITLQWSDGAYTCTISHTAGHSFNGATAEQAYGRALLYLLQSGSATTGLTNAA